MADRARRKRENQSIFVKTSTKIDWKSSQFDKSSRLCHNCTSLYGPVRPTDDFSDTIAVKNVIFWRKTTPVWMTEWGRRKNDDSVAAFHCSTFLIFITCEILSKQIFHPPRCTSLKLWFFHSFCFVFATLRSSLLCWILWWIFLVKKNWVRFI